jgi:hypothetical protein
VSLAWMRIDPIDVCVAASYSTKTHVCRFCYRSCVFSQLSSGSQTSDRDDVAATSRPHLGWACITLSHAGIIVTSLDGRCATSQTTIWDWNRIVFAVGLCVLWSHHPTSPPLHLCPCLLIAAGGAGRLRTSSHFNPFGTGFVWQQSASDPSCPRGHCLHHHLCACSATSGTKTLRHITTPFWTGLCSVAGGRGTSTLVRSGRLNFHEAIARRLFSSASYSLDAVLFVVCVSVATQ